MLPADLFFYGSSSFLIGVLLAGLNINFYIILLAAIPAFIVSLWQWPRKTGFLFLSLIIFGVFYYHFYLNWKVSRENIPLNQEISFSGIVADEPQPKENFQLLTIKLQEPFSGQIKLLTKTIPEYRYGDLLKAKGKIEPPKSKYEEPISFYPEIKISAEHRGFYLKEKLLNLKENLIGQFRRLLPADSAALAAGLTFGWQGDFSKEFKSEMSLSGTTHLVALSGYNISILVLAVANVFGYFLSRRSTFYLTALIIFLFVLMVGAQASVLRAAVMGFLALLAKESGRLFNFRNAVIFAALLMVFFNPIVLLSDIGFQLSFASLLGIVYLVPAIKKILDVGDSGGVFNWEENAIQTLSAQLAVAPLLIQNFGQFSLTSLLANILILEFVPLTMFLGFLLSLLGLLLQQLGFFIAWLANILLVYEIDVVKIFSYWHLSLPNFFGSILFLVFYYLLLVVFAYQYGTKEKN